MQIKFDLNELLTDLINKYNDAERRYTNACNLNKPAQLEPEESHEASRRRTMNEQIQAGSDRKQFELTNEMLHRQIKDLQKALEEAQEAMSTSIGIVQMETGQIHYRKVNIEELKEELHRTIKENHRLTSEVESFRHQSIDAEAKYRQVYDELHKTGMTTTGELEQQDAAHICTPRQRAKRTRKPLDIDNIRPAMEASNLTPDGVPRLVAPMGGGSVSVIPRPPIEVFTIFTDNEAFAPVSDHMKAVARAVEENIASEELPPVQPPKPLIEVLDDMDKELTPVAKGLISRMVKHGFPHDGPDYEPAEADELDSPLNDDAPF